MQTTISSKAGRHFTVRPLTAADSPNIIHIFEQMSAESRYRRFHQPVGQLDEPTTLLHANEIISQTVEQGEGLIAFDNETPIGAARLIYIKENVAEIAMSIADAYQNQGLGKQLLMLLTNSAKNHGWQRLTATIQNENGAIWHLLLQLPYTIVRHLEQGESGVVIHLTAPADARNASLAKFSNFPTELIEATEEATWFTVLLGHSTSAVYRLEQPQEPTRYLKVASAGRVADLVAEKERINWLNGRLPVPTVLDFHQTSHHAFLLMSAVEGTPASDFSNHTYERRIIKQLAKGLQQLHALPIDNCPFSQRLDVELEQAKVNMEAGFVDEADFDEERLGMKTADLYAQLLATRPSREELVFTHGDYCLPNVMVDIEIVRGFIDLGRAGIGDRYRDLALVERSLKYNFGPASVQPFFKAYGLPEPDKEKITYYQLLDEFF